MPGAAGPREWEVPDREVPGITTLAGDTEPLRPRRFERQRIARGRY
jgi:hypothetical protein